MVESVFLLENRDLLPPAGEDVTLVVSRVVLVSVGVVPAMRTRKLLVSMPKEVNLTDPDANQKKIQI